MEPRVLRQMLELGADEVTDGDQMFIGAIALGPRLGRLDASVDGFGEAVVQARPEVFDDTGQVLLHGAGQPFERCQPATLRPTDPSSQQGLGVGEVDVLRKHLAQALFESPGPRGLQARSLQPMHLGDLRGRPVRRILQRAPAIALEVGFVLDLGAAHLIHRLVGQRDHMKRIKAHHRVGAVLAGTGLVGQPQVQTDVGDRMRVATVRHQVVGEGGEGGRVLAWRRKQQTPLLSIAKHRHIALSASCAALVGADPAHRRVIFLIARLLHVVIEHAPHPIVRHTQQAGHCQHRHLLTQRHDEGLQRLREARPRPRPRHADLRRLLAHRAADTRYACLQHRLILKEVQMPPRPRQAIVNRLVDCTARGARQALSGVVDLKDDDAFALAKVDVDHAPRRGEPEGLGEQSFHRQSLPPPPRLGKNSGKINHTIRERAVNTYAYASNDPFSYTDLLGLSPDYSTYWDQYMDFVSDHAINVGSAAAALAGGLWPKSLAPAGGFRGPLLGASNPLTSVPRAFGMPGGGSSVVRGGAAMIGLATVAIGMYDATIEVEGFVYAANDAPPPSAKCGCGK